MKYRIGILFFILCLQSCSREKTKNIQEIGVNQNLYIIDIDKAEQEEKFFLSEICSRVKTIILETNNDALIGQVGGIQSYKDYIFVLDDSRDAKLFAFNREGAFIRKYGSRGIGPGEYLSIKDFTIDADNEIIYLMDDGGRQILLYEINTGKYVNKIKLEESAINCMHIQYNNKKLYTDISYWNTNNNGCLLQEIDLSTGKQKQCWLDATRYNMSWDGGIGIIGRQEESFFYVRHQESCKYIPYFSDTIFSIGKNQIEPYAVIKKNDWITSKDLSKIIEVSTGDVLFAIQEKGFSYNIHSYMEWDDFIGFCYMKHQYRYFVLHNKKTGKTRTTQNLINDLGYNDSGSVNQFVCSDKNGLYEMISMFIIDHYIRTIQEYDILKKSLDKYEQLMNLPEDTNPILFYYEFKKE